MTSPRAGRAEWRAFTAGEGVERRTWYGDLKTIDRAASQNRAGVLRRCRDVRTAVSGHRYVLP